jgi:hypothetical protein
MSVTLVIDFEPHEAILDVGFAPGGGYIKSPADVFAFASGVETHCVHLKAPAHLFFDLTQLMVEADMVDAFNSAKRDLCARYGLSVWNWGGQLAERVMTRNDCTRHGARPNLFKTRADALAAFHRVRATLRFAAGNR